MNDQIIRNLAPTGVLRAGINLRNFLLTSGRADDGEPLGVAPDIAGYIAQRLQVPVRFVLFNGPRQLVDEADNNLWDIGLIGAAPQRSGHIAFTSPYAEIEASYLLAPHSDVSTIEDVDHPGVTIASMTGSGFGLWLERNIRRATLVASDSHESALLSFTTGKLDALAGLRPRLLAYQQQIPGSRLLEGSFTTVQQAIGIANGEPGARACLQKIVEEMKATGFVAQSIARHRVSGLTVAPLSGAP